MGHTWRKKKRSNSPSRYGYIRMQLKDNGETEYPECIPCDTLQTITGFEKAVRSFTTFTCTLMRRQRRSVNTTKGSCTSLITVQNAAGAEILANSNNTVAFTLWCSGIRDSILYVGTRKCVGWLCSSRRKSQSTHNKSTARIESLLILKHNPTLSLDIYLAAHGTHPMTDRIYTPIEF